MTTKLLEDKIKMLEKRLKTIEERISGGVSDASQKLHEFVRRSKQEVSDRQQKILARTAGVLKGKLKQVKKDW